MPRLPFDSPCIYMVIVHPFSPPAHETRRCNICFPFIVCTPYALQAFPTAGWSLTIATVSLTWLFDLRRC
jgi:hypothetical protein